MSASEIADQAMATALGRKVPPTGVKSSACEAAKELLRVADDATADTSFAASLGKQL
jgi:hypothetical protein